MRIKPASDDLPERVAIALNMVPLPAAYALYGMTAGRVVGVAQRLGVFAKLLEGPATVRASAATLGLLFHLTSGADLHSPDELAGYFTEAGFGVPKRTKVRRIPDQGLYQAQAV